MRGVILLVVERPEPVGALPFRLLKGVTLFQPSRFAPVVGPAALKRVKKILRKWLKEAIRNHKVRVGADWARFRRWLWQRANLGDGDVAPAEDHGLATFDAVEVLRETRLGIGEVHFDHMVRLLTINTTNIQRDLATASWIAGAWCDRPALPRGGRRRPGRRHGSRGRPIPRLFAAVVAACERGGITDEARRGSRTNSHFVDMLGFAALIEKHPCRIKDAPPTDDGYEVVHTAPTQSQFNLFDQVLDLSIQQPDGGITAMFFSDCAFLNPGNSVRAALIATDLMRKFIKVGVPVRMGIGKGTFYSFGYSTDTGGDSMLVSKSRFIGTAVVRAHAAEQCGGKGMRIFVHPKVDGLDSHADFKILSVPKAFKAAKWELDYLCRSRSGQERSTVDACDRDLFSRVAAMKDPKAKLSIR